MEYLLSMVRDEFNNVEITNDKQLLKVEFGKTQAAEFTSKKENPLPEGDLNEKYVGKTIKKETEVNVDYINKVPTHATQTVVQGTTTATGAAAATATTAVAASTVAVVAIATVTGISAALHDYKYDFKSLIISSNELRYELVVYDALQSEEDYYRSFEESDQEPSYEEGREEGSSAPFKLQVSNKNYNSTQYLWAYSTNIGTFDNLTLGETYSILLSENRYGGEEIFKDTFTTFTNSTLSEFELYQYTDCELGTFNYSLDYVDDDDSISGITLEFYEPETPEKISASFALDKAKGYQTYSALDGQGNALIELNKKWGYSVFYTRNNENIKFKEGMVEFEDYAGRTSEFRQFVFDKKANFLDNTFQITLDFDDYFGWYDDFKLKITQIPKGNGRREDTTGSDQYYSQEISLLPTKEPQTIDLNEYEMFLNNSNFEYTYSLTCNYRGILTTLAEETVPFSFTDNSGFNSFTLSREANFINNSINVTLDYDDSLGLFDNFVLTMTLIPSDDDGSNQGDYYSQEIPLRSTNETQTIVLNEYEMYVRDSYFKYTYLLTCSYKGETKVLAEETTPFSFTDISGGVSEFHNLEFSKEANFLTNTFKVKLDYQDDFDSLYNFVLHLYPEGVNAQYDFNLEKTTEEQTCTFNENQHWNFSFDYTYSYSLTYYDDNGEETIRDENSFVFTDISGGVSEFRGVTFTGNYVMSTGLAPIQLDYQDDFGYLSDFVLRLFGPITNSGDPNPFRAGGITVPEVEDYPYEIELEKTTEVQYINLYESEIPTSMEGEYLYAVTYNYRGQPKEPIKGAEQIEFYDPDAMSVVNGITFVNGEANFNNRSFVVKLDFQDDYGYFSNFSLQVWDSTNGGWVEKDLDTTTDPQTVVIDEFNYEDQIYPVDIVSGNLTYNLVYVSSETGDPATQYFYEQAQPLSFVNSLKSEFYGLETTFDITVDENSGECRLPFRFDMINDAEYFSVPELYITSVDDEENVLASFQFANEVMSNNWQYGSFSPYGDFTVEELTNGNEYNLVVACYEKDGYDGAEQRNIKYLEPHSFTLNQNLEVCGIDMQNYILAGEWQGYLTLIGNGDVSSLENGQIIFESRLDGTRLTYDLTLSEYVSFDLLSPKDRTTTEQFISDFFSAPVDVYFKYSKPGSEDVIMLSCYTSILFNIYN